MPVSKDFRAHPMYAGAQSDKERAADTAGQDRVWTYEELAKVRDATIALVRTHRPIDAGPRSIVAGFDGATFWHLLGALDRLDRTS